MQPGIAQRALLGALLRGRLHRTTRLRVGNLHNHSIRIGETMSNIIGFLEQTGANAAMRHASREHLLQSIRENDFAPALQAALLHTHGSPLAELLGARAVMFSPNQRTPKPATKTPARKPAKKAPAKKR